jgi:hypothetical protein
MKQTFFERLRTTEEALLHAVEIEEQTGFGNPYSMDAHSAIGRLKRYVYSCKWRNTPKTKIAVRNVHRKATEVAVEMECSPHTVRSVRSQLSKQLFDIFGISVFERILSETDLPALITKLEVLEQGYSNVERLLPAHILEMLEGLDFADGRNFTVEDFDAEIEFLKENTTAKLRDKVEDLNKDRLSVLYNLLLRGGNDEAKMELLQMLLVDFI